jgi:hypothetical protein
MVDTAALKKANTPFLKFCGVHHPHLNPPLEGEEVV